ncbi:MAG: MFS transporter [Gammaproteobacteria bacterium]|nr:MFS transporter [Gammaproteobacteria bacterium]MBT8074640.1 MFS transporter [Gammaproteobacteria bacterium]
MKTGDPAAASGLSSNRAYVLFILVLVYTFNFIDRQIVGILAIPIKADLGLTDGQLGLMGGLAFALFYTGLGIPVAMLADRFNRTWIITTALVIWSGMTAVSGLANNFWQLFAARLGVGIGEAGGVAPAYSLIADYFPPGRRARALSVYSFGIPIGSAIGIVFGGIIASMVSWRAAFFVVGLAGIVLAPIFRMTVREPPRGRYDRKRRDEAAPGLRLILRTLVAKPSFWLLSVGASFSSMMGYGVFFWLPSFFVRSYNLTLLNASLFYGAVLLLGGLAGIWAGGWLGDRFGQDQRSQYARIPAFAFIASVPFYLLAILSPTLTLAFFVLLVPTALGLVWLGPVISVIQHLVRPDMRATASAIFLFINNLIGIGLGTYAIGALSDLLAAQFGDESLRYSILAGTGFYIVAATLFFLAARWLDRDWED